MMDPVLIYGLAACALIALGFRSVLLQTSLLGQIIAINVSGAGVFLLFVSHAYRGSRDNPDPLLHALVLTGIVVAISATALALTLGRCLSREDDE